ncbi:hypothetical protein Ccrd_003559 [Cynara cardunculus var. scolymus]|uniref:Uncharacterized protein n=1 Tax=Cynara cardunculus var. scolymus TaxID=59895 RepID=A0A118JVP3_CYNCS|nr:hypothetical protein Ccrd_003559 [Cynara cardunculus var. scolymus]
MGIRLEKWSPSASNHQEFITKSSSSINGEKGLTMATDQVSPAGINRKLMTKTIASSSTTTNYNKTYKIHDPKSDVKFTHGQVENEEVFSTTSTPENSKHRNTQIVSEQYLDVIDITGMDYSPAKRKPPIHN